MRITLAALMCIWALSAQGGEVFRCVTENGVTRYSDTPCEDGHTQKLDIESRPTDVQAVEERAEQRKARIADRNEAEAEARKTRQAAQKQAEQRAQRCAAAQDRLQRLRAARRITSGEGEERRYLDSAEIEKRRQEAAQKVSELCVE